MCGIVAVVSKKSYGFNRKEVDVFEQLLYADALRGEDSTGIIGVNKYGDLYIDKSAEDAHNFMVEYVNSGPHKEMISNGVALIGHNRKATVGKIIDDNAHPFVINNHFAMVHNGSLYNHQKLKETTVDSEALAHHIESAIHTEGFNTDILGEALSDVWGAYACVWYDQKNHKVQFLRNDQRPLWCAEGVDAWFLASEGGMLHWILSRNNVTFKGLASTTKDTLHTLFPGTAKQISVETIPEKKSPPVTSTKGTGSSSTTETSSTKTDAGKLGQDSTVAETASKNQFKRLNKKLVGKPIEFWIDDWVEKHLFETNRDETDFLIMGESDTLQGFRHVVRGEVNLDDLEILSVENLDNFFYRGTIQRMEFDLKQKVIVVHLHKIIKIPSISTITKVTLNEETSATLH